LQLLEAILRERDSVMLPLTESRKSLIQLHAVFEFRSSVDCFIVKVKGTRLNGDIVIVVRGAGRVRVPVFTIRDVLHVLL
jgi:hypothetical protein